MDLVTINNNKITLLKLVLFQHPTIIIFPIQQQFQKHFTTMTRNNSNIIGMIMRFFLIMSMSAIFIKEYLLYMTANSEKQYDIEIHNGLLYPLEFYQRLLFI